MEYRNWKNAPVRTSLLGYGCMRFPTTPEGRIDEPRAEALLNAARDAGVNYFDTAYPYHGGESEPFVGRVIAKWPRESFYLATKLPLWQCKSLDEAKRIFADQQKRLGVDYFDFYLLHSLHKARYDEAKALGIVDWLWEQKAAGTIRSLGFSCHDHSAGFEHILRDQPWDFCQLQYNYLDTDDRAEEISGDRGYQLTEELGVPLIIMEPIKGGTLATLPPDAEAPLKALRPEASAASWALRWVGSHQNVHVILSGMSAEVFFDDSKLVFQRQRQGQTVNDLLIALLDLTELPAEILPFCCQGIAGVKHICHLRVLVKAFARRGRYHKTSACIGTDDRSYFFELFGAGKRTTAEFYNFFHLLSS